MTEHQLIGITPDVIEKLIDPATNPKTRTTLRRLFLDPMPIQIEYALKGVGPRERESARIGATLAANIMAGTAIALAGEEIIDRAQIVTGMVAAAEYLLRQWCPADKGEEALAALIEILDGTSRNEAVKRGMQ